MLGKSYSVVITSGRCQVGVGMCDCGAAAGAGGGGAFAGALAGDPVTVAINRTWSFKMHLFMDS